MFSITPLKGLNVATCKVKFFYSMRQHLLLGDTHIHWSQSIKYLGVYVTSGKTLSFDMNPMKRAFYAACNSIFANTDGLNEMALLSLQEAYSLSILMYAAPALHLSVKQTNELNVCWNMVFAEYFGIINGSLFGL